ncbi:MAG: hypothetical protein ABSH01_14355 [Terriglobia bacterium]
MEQQVKNENFNGRWRDIAPIGFVLLAAFVALVAFHRCSGLGKSLSNDYYAMVGTTLLAAVLGFGAIWHQTRSSYRQLREQLAAQRDAEGEERERQKRAIATAILFEIDSFYRIELKLVENTLSSWDSATEPLPTAVGLRGNTSDIYRANSVILGSLGAKSVSAIVKFYSMVGLYEGLFRDYQHCLDMASHGVNPAVNESCARERLNTIRGLIPELRKLKTGVCNSVARDCGLDELVEKDDAQTH